MIRAAIARYVVRVEEKHREAMHWHGVGFVTRKQRLTELKRDLDMYRARGEEAAYEILCEEINRIEDLDNEAKLPEKPNGILYRMAKEITSAYHAELSPLTWKHTIALSQLIREANEIGEAISTLCQQFGGNHVQYDVLAKSRDAGNEQIKNERKWFERHGLPTFDKEQ